MGKHHGRFEPTGWFAQRRRSRMVQWMWDLVNELVQCVPQEKPEIREFSSRAEPAVRPGIANCVIVNPLDNSIEPMLRSLPPDRSVTSITAKRRARASGERSAGGTTER